MVAQRSLSGTEIKKNNKNVVAQHLLFGTAKFYRFENTSSWGW
jgi:hypothetical protein